ncbi:MAG: hypothetical protein MUC65_08540 [Pontiellaceae bacterium]|nr:hypothetical protein [Pontiellaceae bacterium]
MKKIIAIVLGLACALGAEEVKSNDNSVGAIGVGYQGILLGELFQGASVRYSPNDAPIMAQLIYARLSADIEGIDIDLDLFETRLAYVLIQRENSKFYVGGKLGYMAADAEGGDLEGFTYGLLFGTEWRFTELPEIGFNFDVGYDFRNLDAEGNDIQLNNVGISLGATYYF